MTAIIKEINPSTDAVTGQTMIDLAQARQVLEAQACRLRRSLADSQTHYGPDAHPTLDNDDDDIYAGTLAADLTAGSQLATNTATILAQCEHALQRINDGHYNVCDQCAQPISTERLLAIPRATRCATCQ